MTPEQRAKRIHHHTYETCEGFDKDAALTSAVIDLDIAHAEGFHCGYEAGLHARDTATWQLDQERREVVRALKAVNLFLYYEKDNGMLAAIASCIDGMRRWNQENCEHLRDRLIHLLGGDTTKDTTKTSDLRLDTDLSNTANGTVTAELRDYVKRVNLGGCSGEYLYDCGMGIADGIDAELAKRCKLLDDSWHATCEQMMAEQDKRYMELPKTTSGEPIRVGDLVRTSFHGTVEVVGVAPKSVFFKAKGEDGKNHVLCNSASGVSLAKEPDAAERMVTDYALGRITEQQLVERIREAMDG